MNYECTNDTHTYTQWLITLVTIIFECANIEPCDLAINEEEVKCYYNDGISPYKVYNKIWMEDAGHFYAI